jgi:rubrerythrin
MNNTNDSLRENTEPCEQPALSPELSSELSSERRRVLHSGAKVLVAGAGLLLARPFGRAAWAQDAATNTTPAAGDATSMSGMGTAMEPGAGMAGEAGVSQATQQGRMTGKEQATGKQPLAPGDFEQNRAPAGTMSGPQGLPDSARIKETEKPGADETNDVAILNFALTLEHLESEFYTRVVAADEARAFLRGRPKTLARVLARDEATHVEVVADAIRKLGGTPIEKPNFQFPNDAFISQVAFLQLSAQLEETGVSAYLGQGRRVRRRDVLNFAASIYGNEARHTAMIRFYLGDVFAPRDLELPLSMEQVLERARPFIV